MIHRRTAAAILAAVIALSGCARTPEQKAARFLQRGKTLYDHKDYARALLEFSNAVRTAPANGEAAYHLGLAHLAVGDYNRALLSFQKAVKLDPRQNAARLKLAELMATSQKREILEEVDRMARKALELDPGSGEAMRVRALAEMRLGDLETAVRSLEESVAKSPKNVQAAATLAASKLVKRDAAGAEAVMRKMAAEVNSAEGWLALGRFLRLLGRTSDADEAVRTAAKTVPASAEALLELALLQSRSGQQDQAAATFAQLSALPDERFRCHHAMFLFDTGRRDEAIREMERLVSKYPADRDTRTRLLMAYMATRRVSEAEELMTKVLKRNPKDVDALLLRSRIHLGAGNLAAAEADLNQVLSFKPDSPEAHYWKAKVHFAANRRQQFEQEMGEALRLNPMWLDARLELARSLRSAHDPKLALEHIEKMPAAQRTLLASVIDRNWLLFDLRREAELKASLKAALQSSRHPTLLLQHALVSMREKQFGAARTALEEILKKNPEEYRAVTTMLALFLAENRRPASVDWLRKHAAQRPNSAQMAFVVGQWLAESGDLAGARASYQRARELDPKHKPAELELAKLDLAAGNFQAARDRVSGLLQADPRDLPARMTLAAIEEKSGNGAAALEQYQLVLVADPRHVVALNNLAYLLAEHTNNLEEALNYAAQAGELAPESSAVHDTLGRIFYKKGIYNLAVNHLESAVKAEPTALRKTHLGLAYYALGRVELARKTVNEALRQQPDLVDAQAALVAVAKPR